MEVSQNPTEKKYLKISIGAQESWTYVGYIREDRYYHDCTSLGFAANSQIQSRLVVLDSSGGGRQPTFEDS